MKAQPGAVRMASDAGTIAIVDAAPAIIRPGIRNGARRCAKVSIFYAMPWQWSLKRLAANCCTIPGRPETIISSICSILQKRRSMPFSTNTAGCAFRQNERTVALQLLEAQKYALFCYTSCAWFFDDISGLEPIQNMRYAARTPAG